MNYSVKLGILKKRGYTFQKLYANNYITYRKGFGFVTDFSKGRNIGTHTIWLWAKGRDIEVDDWYDRTEYVINYYKNNIAELKNNKPEVKIFHCWMTTLKGTPEFSMNTVYNMFQPPEGGYEKWRSVVICIPEFEELLKEIDFLQQ